MHLSTNLLFCSVVIDFVLCPHPENLDLCKSKKGHAIDLVRVAFCKECWLARGDF